MTDAPRAREWIDQCQNLISRRGHRIAFRRRGQGPVVLLLHGFPTWSYDYAVVAHDLARDHDVITLDFLGYGASDKPNPYEYSVVRIRRHSRGSGRAPAPGLLAVGGP